MLLTFLYCGMLFKIKLSKYQMTQHSKLIFLNFSLKEQPLLRICTPIYFNFLSLTEVTSQMLAQDTHWGLRFLAILWPFQQILLYTRFKNSAASALQGKIFQVRAGSAFKRGFMKRTF